MKLQIEIDIDGAAFRDEHNLIDWTALEQAINRVASLVDYLRINESKSFPVFDNNSNAVGFARLVESTDKCQESLRDQAVAYLHYTEKEREHDRIPKAFGAWTLEQVVDKSIPEGVKNGTA